MKFILKILLAPIVAVLAILVWLCTGIIKVSGMMMSIVSILFIGASVLYFIGGNTVNGCIGLALAALFCPYGLPMLAIILLGVVQQLRFAIQDRVYR